MKKGVVIGVAVGVLGVGGLGVAWVVGSTLPQEHQTRLTVATRQGPVAVWAIVSDFEGQPEWRKDVVRVERVDDIAGKQAWRETTAGGGAVTLVTARWSPPHSFTRDHVEDGYLVGTWSVDLVPEGMGTRITVTEMRRTPSPLSRIAEQYLGGAGSSSGAYLRALADHLGDNENQVVEADDPPPEP